MVSIKAVSGRIHCFNTRLDYVHPLASYVPTFTIPTTPATPLKPKTVTCSAEFVDTLYATKTNLYTLRYVVA